MIRTVSPRRQPVVTLCRLAYGAFIPLVAEGGGYQLGHAAVKGVHAACTVEIQHAVHHRQRPSAALPHAGALQRRDLVRAGGADVQPLHAVLLEKQHRAQIGRRPGEHAVAAPVGGVAVGGQPGEGVPVAEIPQCAAVHGVDALAVHDAVLAAPQPVAALHHKVHVRHIAPHRHSGGLLPLNGGHRADDDGIVAALQQRPCAVRRSAGAAGEGHAVPGGEARSDACGAELQRGVVHRLPHHAVIAHQRRAAAGVQPQVAAFGAGGSRRPGGIALVFRAVGAAQGVGDGAGGLDGVFQTAPVAEVLGVDVFLVGPDQQICAHADQLLFTVRQRQIDGQTVDVQRPAVHPDQAVLGGKAVGLVQRRDGLALFPHRQRGIAVPCQVLHPGKGAQRRTAPRVIAPKLADRHALLRWRLEL